MTIAISTAVASGTLPQKLDKIAQSGFSNVELSEADFTRFDGTAKDVASQAKDRGLHLSLLESADGFEGLLGEARSRSLRRLEQKIDLMKHLGIELLLVHASSSQLTSVDTKRVFSDFEELASIASINKIRIAFLALPMASHVKDALAAYQFIKEIDSPHLGLGLDSMLLMGDGSRPAKFREIKGRHVFHVNLFDMLRRDAGISGTGVYGTGVCGTGVYGTGAHDTDSAVSSLESGMLPGQGNLNIAGLIRLLVSNGYRGAWSIGGTRQHPDLIKSSHTQTDAYRALVNVLHEVRGTIPNTAFSIPDLTDRVYASGIEFIEFAVDDESHKALTSLLSALRFRRERLHKTKDVELWRQGAINIVVNSDKRSFAGKAFAQHGPIVCDMGLRVKDADKTVDRATALGAPEFSQALGDNELDIPAINGVGGNVIHFIDEKSNLHHVWEIEFDSTRDFPKARPAGLRRIDHVAQTMKHQEMQSWLLYYISTFEMEKTPLVDVADPSGVITSQAIQSPEGEVRLNINGVKEGDTFAGNFLSGNVGAGVQHIAFATDDIFETSEILKQANFPRLAISPNYYAAITSEFALSSNFVEQLRDGNILYSRRGNSEYFQIYSQSIFSGFFFEIVERRNGYAGYGAKNAPIRLAAQSEFQQTRGNAA